MIRIGYFFFGALSLLLGAAGTAIPLLPTVPFLLLAAFCFARAHPRLEAWLLDHRHFGPHIHAWRRTGAIRPGAKRLAVASLAVSAGIGFFTLHAPWSLLPPLVCLVVGAWILSRPSR